MKTVALLHYAFPPKIGGVEVLVKQHAELLTEYGYDVKVLTGTGGSTQTDYLVTVVSELQSLLVLNPTLYDSILVEGVRGEEYDSLEEKLLHILERELADRDTVIVHNMLTLYHNMPFISAFRAYVKRYPEKQYLAWVHDHTYLGFERVRLDEIHLPTFVHQLLITPIADVRYIAISHTLKKLLPKVMDLPQEEIAVIPNGVNIQKFLGISDSLWQIVQSHGLLDAFPLVLSPVNVLGRKNLEYSLEVVAELKKKYPSIKYLITGKPSDHRKNQGYEDFLKEQVKKLDLSQQVLFMHELVTEYLSPEAIHDCYSISDIVFNFSKGENFGLPLVESMLAKTPLIVSNLQVFEEVTKGQAIILDPSKTSAQEVGALLDHAIKTTKTVQGFRIAKAEYSLQSIVRSKLLPLLEA